MGAGGAGHPVDVAGDDGPARGAAASTYTGGPWQLVAGGYFLRRMLGETVGGLVRFEPGNVASLGFVLEVVIVAAVFASVVSIRAGLLSGRDVLLPSTAAFNRATEPGGRAWRAMRAPLALMPLLAPILAFAIWREMLVLDISRRPRSDGGELAMEVAVAHPAALVLGCEPGVVAPRDALRASGGLQRWDLGFR